MKSYLNLIPISVKVRKRQNRLTIICILLAVFLVTAIFSMADMTVRMEMISALNTHGSWHIMLKDISDNDAELISMRSDTDVVSPYDSLNSNIKMDWYIGNKKTAVCTMDEEWVTDIFNILDTGRYPVTDNEALLSCNSKDILNIDVGDSFVMNTPQGNYSYIVSGFVKESSALKYDAVIMCVTGAEFEHIGSILGSKDSDPVFYIRFKDGVNVRKTIENIKREYGFTDANISENTAVLGLMGFSSGSYIVGLYGIAAVLFLLILTAGVFMIAGSLNSDVESRTEIFGMLRCIGAEKKQVIRIVRLEALNRCKTAIPLGAVLGVALSWLLCAIMKYGIGGEFETMPLFEISYTGIAFGIIIGIITVLFASSVPARRASKVSPVTAVMGNGKNIKRSLSKGFLSIETALGINNALYSKKNIFLMTGSFALSIILFMSFSVFVDWTHKALNPLSPFSPDVSVVSSDRSCTVDRALVKELGGISGVKRIYGRMFKGDVPIVPYKNIEKIDIISYEEHQFKWAEECILEGNIAEAVQGSCMLSVYDRSNPLKTGDRFNIGNTEIEVAGILSSDIPFEVTEGTPLMICSEELFTRLTGEENYAVIDLQLDKDISHDEVLEIRHRAGDNYIFSDRRETNMEIKNTYLTFSILIYSFVGIIALIALFNIINSISVSVNTAKKKYGIMRALGMSGTQLVKMIGAEALTYSLFGCIVGCGAGIFINRYMFIKIIGAYFGDSWRIPIFNIAAVIVFICIASVIAVYFPSKRIMKSSAAEVLHTE